MCVPPHVAFAIRPNPGFWEFVKVNSDDLSVDPINEKEYLITKETVSDEAWYNPHRISHLTYVFRKSLTMFTMCFFRAKEENALEFDFGAYDSSMPHMRLSSSIGKGASFLSKFITGKFRGNSLSVDMAQPLVDYLQSLSYQGDV